MTDSYDRRAFQPFLSGPRACGGVRLARMEVRAALIAFIRRYEVTRGDGPVRVAYGMTMQPATWNELSFSKR
jgi:cytochrome P450